jgi:hypothetical protein
VMYKSGFGRKESGVQAKARKCRYAGAPGARR